MTLSLALPGFLLSRRSSPSPACAPTPLPHPPSPRQLRLRDGRIWLASPDSSSLQPASANFDSFFMDSAHQLFLGDPPSSSNPIALAGTVLIRDGHIRTFCPDTRYLIPTLRNLPFLLQAFAMHRVPLHRIQLFTPGPNPLPRGSAFDFLQTHLSAPRP